MMSSTKRKSSGAKKSIKPAGKGRGGRTPYTAGLIVREREPLNLEYPFPTLDGFITPAESFYVRNHFPDMPESALAHVEVDYCLPLAEIAPLLVRLTIEATEEEGAFEVPKEVEIEVNIAKEQKALDAGVLELGEPSNYACPECHGVLLQMKGGALLRFRCHTGHAYSAESLMADIMEKMDDALWNSIRAFEEGEIFMRRMAEHLSEGHNVHTAEAFLKRADETKRRGVLMRQAATNGAEPDTEAQAT